MAPQKANSPATPYRALQKRAKEAGIAANQSRAALEALLGEDSAPTSSVAAPKSSGLLEGLAGTTNCSFFAAPSWVDLSLVPGQTDQTAVARDTDWCAYYSGKFLFFSPNLVWLAIALLDYFIFPFDYETAAKLDRAYAVVTAKRLAVNAAIVFSYFGFWHLATYFWGWSTRPFKPNRVYRYSKVVHNMWYTFLGAVQWTAWEAVFVHCYASGKMPFIPDSEALKPENIVQQFVVWCFLIPIYREVHFYFAHRMTHLRSLYTYVHSLHHRNTDIEPFAGLCMHPVEHLFYFSCVAPALYFKTSPFIFLWNGVHLLISPAASHSGYEDHFQSDQYHYLHHRFFECNYGTSGMPFDYIFGTFREKLDQKGRSKTYKGAATETKGDHTGTADMKATLVGLPTWDHALYDAVCCVGFPALIYSAALGLEVGKLGYAHKLSLFGLSNATTLALALSLGPVVVGATLLLVTLRPRALKQMFCSGSLVKTREAISKRLLYPFHLDKVRAPSFPPSFRLALCSSVSLARSLRVLVRLFRVRCFFFFSFFSFMLIVFLVRSRSHRSDSPLL